jgi:hypothetical protein
MYPPGSCSKGYACPYLWAMILWCFLPDKFPVDSFRHFYAAYVSQRRANVTFESSFDSDREGPRIESQAFVCDCRDGVLWHRIYVICNGHALRTPFPVNTLGVSPCMNEPGHKRKRRRKTPVLPRRRACSLKPELKKSTLSWFTCLRYRSSPPCGHKTDGTSTRGVKGRRTVQGIG